MRLEENSENKSTYFTALNELKWFPFFDFFCFPLIQVIIEDLFCGLFLLGRAPISQEE